MRLTVLVAALLAALTLVPLAPAASTAACAQRVIRDWYSGGRVDRVYPLHCYPAAIRALPEDVLQYSDADRDIARALAYARRGRTEKPSSPAPSTSPRKAPPAPAKHIGGPTRLASGPESVAASGGVPYPIIVLTLLSGVLLVSAAAGWAMRHRR